MKNQCDGCARGLLVNNGHHYISPDHQPTQACDAWKYCETKTHMVTINNRTVFVTFPGGVRPHINLEDLERLFGVKDGQCIRIG